MRIVVREAAAGDLDEILDWISRDNPRAAADLTQRILARIGRVWSKERASWWNRPISLFI